MICAVVNKETKVMENMIVADAMVDPAPEGYILLPVPNDYLFEPGITFDGQKLVRKEKIPPVKKPPVDGIERL